MSERSAKKDRRSRIRRRAFAGIGEADVVGYFDHQKMKPNITIREHKIESNNGCPIMYSVNDVANEHPNVIEIGTEVNTTDEGYDYVVAKVDRQTGETEWRPARLFKFEARYTNDRAITLGEKRKAPVDYSQDYTVSTTEWAEKRSELTKQFGSSMKRKIQEAAVRRSVNNETLDAMVKTSFASETVIKNKNQIKLEDISMVQQVESSVLPPAVQTDTPKDIYPLKLFVSEDEVAQLREVAENMLTNSKTELLEKGWPDVLFKTCPDYSSLKGTRAVALNILGCQAYALGIMTKANSISKADFENFPFPSEILYKVQADYMPQSFDRGVSGKAIPRLILTTEQKERLIAYTLALALALSPGISIPISPWYSAMKVSPKHIEKVLTGLGCTIMACNVDEAVATGSIQSARLLKPPSLDKKGPRKVRR